MIDSSAINADEQRQAVLEVLQEIGVPQAKLDNCMMEAWNKVLSLTLIMWSVEKIVEGPPGRELSLCYRWRHCRWCAHPVSADECQTLLVSRSCS